MASNYFWFFDPGHGGIINGEYQTRGKRSPKFEDGRQLFEGEFNRAIVNRVMNMCQQNGIDCIDLVDSQEDIPLPERTNTANDIYNQTLKPQDRECIYVSVHANAHGSGNELSFNSAHGWEVFTSKGETKSDKIATAFFDQMKREFPDKRFRTNQLDGDPDKEANFYVLKHTIMPAVLTENFFMTNREEAELLLSEVGRDKIARAHFNAIRFIEENGIG